VRVNFTGQRRDANTGLGFYNARYYDSEIGRFISADSIVPGAGDATSFNRYAYVRNNPLRYIDPSGHKCGATDRDAGACTDPVAIKNPGPTGGGTGTGTNPGGGSTVTPDPVHNPGVPGTTTFHPPGTTIGDLLESGFISAADLTGQVLPESVKNELWYLAGASSVQDIQIPGVLGSTGPVTVVFYKPGGRMDAILENRFDGADGLSVSDSTMIVPLTSDGTPDLYVFFHEAQHVIDQRTSGDAVAWRKLYASTTWFHEAMEARAIATGLYMSGQTDSQPRWLSPVSYR